MGYIKRHDIWQLIAVVVGVQGAFLLSAFPEIEGGAEPCADRLLIHDNIRMNQLVG